VTTEIGCMMLLRRALLLLTLGGWLALSVRCADYATLYTVRSGDASGVHAYGTAFDVSLDELELVQRARLSGRHAQTVLLGSLCQPPSVADNASPSGTTVPAMREFTFNDETLLDPARRADYTMYVDYNCSRPADTSPLRAAIEFGTRTRDSAMWRIWSYASFSSTDIRLGRHHPRRSLSLSDDAATLGKIGCKHSSDEQLCAFDVQLMAPHGTSALGNYTVDVLLDDSRVYVPYDVYMHYTSPTWPGNATLRRLDDWPPLVFRATGAAVDVTLDVRLFVPVSFEATFEAPTLAADWPPYVAQLLRESGVLVASDDAHAVLVGTRLFERYTLHRDYVRATMHVQHAPVVDHFTLLEMLLFVVIFTAYLEHKASITERLALLLLGSWPRCVLCKADLRTSWLHCESPHARTWRWKCVVGVRTLKELAVVVGAWFAVAGDLRLNHSSALAVWAYSSLCVASALYVGAVLLSWWRSRSRTEKPLDAYVVLSVRSSSFEFLAVLSLLALSSVVCPSYSEGVANPLLFCCTLLVVYDAFRHALLGVLASVRRAHARQQLTHSAYVVLYVFSVAFVHRLVYTTYTLTRYIVLPTLDYGLTFALLAVAAAYMVALSVTSAYVRKGMLYARAQP